MAKRNWTIIESPSELGAGTRGASLGPSAVRLEDAARGGKIYNQIPHKTLALSNSALFQAIQFPHAKHINGIAKAVDVLCNAVKNELHNEKFPLVISGDHSNAAGSIAGLKDAYPEKRIGVIWIDAHGDLHTPFTTPSGNVHGMPLAASLGDVYRSQQVNKPDDETLKYWKEITHAGEHNIHPKIKPEDLVLVDIRDLEEQEWIDIEDNNIKTYLPSRLRHKGMRELGKECLKYLNHCDLIYVTYDVDCMDPSVSKGTGTSVDNGLSLEEGIELLQSIMESEKVAVLEITEINPLLDTENKMATAVIKILDSLL